MVPADANSRDHFLCGCLHRDVSIKDRLKRGKKNGRASHVSIYRESVCLILYYVFKYFPQLTHNNIIL